MNCNVDESVRGRIRIACLTVFTLATTAFALTENALPQQPTTDARPAAAASNGASATSSKDQAALEKKLVEMLSGATLEGSFTSTGAGRDPSKLSREKYTLGEVRKLTDKFWSFPARIEYGGHDVTIPVNVPVEWAGDTPVIVVDNVPLPGFGTVSARVMFFADHYAGWWQHGTHGGHLFGTITRGDKSNGDGAEKSSATSTTQQPAGNKATK